ncbi:hypothetical protein XFF6166_90004 [Xanthomonas citri pv. fuscans]|nr:hypothetical protein XFF6166_90004 [Xanthomonas citri pv. fuscans]SOO03873.1 hypothetical protein XFF7767_20016 [Xanthomonas citri pv. fuscans]SOO03985.1 hypothetical protein XFF6960_900017 [Xanthomonas citri pv. fuscans]SOO16135.1 hypothetical protein XFF7766_750016 [Xanthomonas citri pv. fuscans]
MKLSDERPLPEDYGRVYDDRSPSSWLQAHLPGSHYLEERQEAPRFCCGLESLADLGS